MWSVFVLLVLLVAGGFYCIREGWIGYMPPLDELQSPISKYASQIITSDGKVIGTWSRNENRVFVDYDSISPYVFQALVATEDVRFYEHSGIDVRALGRAIVKRDSCAITRPEVVVPSPSSWPSSSIRRPRRAPRADSCRNL